MGEAQLLSGGDSSFQALLHLLVGCHRFVVGQTLRWLLHRRPRVEQKVVLHQTSTTELIGHSGENIHARLEQVSQSLSSLAGRSTAPVYRAWRALGTEVQSSVCSC